MSDNSEPEFDFGSFFDLDDTFDEAAFWQEPDFLLSDLVSTLVNMGGAELGVTLTVGGLVLTGTLVSERSYLQAITDLFTRQAKQVLKNQSEEAQRDTEEAFDFTGLAETVIPEELDEDEGNEDEDSALPLNPIRFLHLKDPVVISPQPAITFMHSELPIMRIRLNRVGGWLLGRAAPVESDSSDEVLH